MSFRKKSTPLQASPHEWGGSMKNLGGYAKLSLKGRQQRSFAGAKSQADQVF
jgi:hypothetical protein